MIIKEQKPIIIKNQCNAIFDEEELKRAILWYSDRPVSRIKTVYMYGQYPAVSIYFQKIHIHRLLMMYWLQRDLNRDEYIHHKDGNKLNATKENLELIDASIHQSLHNKGRILSKEHKRKIAEANRKRKGTRKKKRVNISLNELKEFLGMGWSINKIAQYYGCDWTTVKNRIYENPELLEGKDD